MEDNQWHGPRTRLRWSFGSIMVLTVATVVVLALVRPLANPAPKSS